MTTDSKPHSRPDELGSGEVQGASARSSTEQSPSNQHSVWGKEDLFVAARAGIAPRDSGRSPAHPDNWEATNAIDALKELEQQMNDLEEQLETLRKALQEIANLDLYSNDGGSLPYIVEDAQKALDAVSYPAKERL